MQKPLFSALPLLALLFLFGCSQSSPDQAELWYVSYFDENKIDAADDTGKFTGYTFEFNADDEWIIHTPDGSVITAKWGSDAATVSFSIDNPASPLDALTGDWDVTDQSDTILKLKEKAGFSTPGVERPELHFQKQ
jgi:hypothetical protein